MKISLGSRQRGAVIILLFVGLFIAGAALLATTLSRLNPSQQNNARIRTEMQQVKQILLSYAALYGDNYPTKGPGRLPCPDTNNDAVMECNTIAQLGRLPQSVQISASLLMPLSSLDAGVDQQLWYAVSTAYQHKSAPSIVNSSIAGSITLDGDEVVALIIAPGPVLSGQNRLSGPTVSANYLEFQNATAPDFVSTISGNIDSFNDMVLPIRRQEIMTVVTPRVAQEIRRVLETISPYPIDQAAFNTAMLGAYPWFAANNWLAQTTYTYSSADSATLTFAGCNMPLVITRISVNARITRIGGQNSCD